MGKAKGAEHKRIFSLCNFIILICVIAIIASLVMIIKPNFNQLLESILGEFKDYETVTASNGIKIVISNTKGRISEENAKELAKNQFKELGDKVEKDKIKVMRIVRKGEGYYYVTSPRNSLEIQITTGKITRINSEIIENNDEQIITNTM